jgi:HPt (histidine-containing phosphotransfer) domain-containing protein
MITTLLIDHGGTARDTLRDALAMRGGILLDATALTDHDTPDIVVVGDPPGLERVRQVRASHPRLPIVFLAARAQDLPVVSQLVNELGVALVVNQPVDPTVFARQLLAVVARLRDRSPPATRPTFAAELAALRAAFAAKLPDKLAEIAAAIAAARWNPAHAPAARMLAHRLSGSAGSYGHTALGATLEALEHALESGAAATVDALMETARAHVLQVREPGS